MAGADIQLVVGLGNPGDRYAGTRHNVGFRALDMLLENAGGRWGSAAVGEGAAAKLELHGRPVWAVKPHTYMNASGGMVGSLARFYKIAAPSVLVVADDFNIPLGRIRVRGKGSAGGQKGLNSILTHLGTQEVPRIRVGIGPVPGRRDPADFVLGRFRPDEREAVERVLERTVSAIGDLCGKGLEAAMNAYNAKEP